MARLPANWEAALEKFLVPWKKRKEVTGALVCGSYVTGDPTPHSDIDVHILLRPSTKWRERGNDIVDGFLIEYFSNPPQQIRRYFAEDHRDHRQMCATQFATGRVVFDSAGAVRKLKGEARRWIDKPFRKPSRVQTLGGQYGLWDGLDNFREAYEREAPDLTWQYHACLRGLLDAYARHLGDGVTGVSKTYAYLTSAVLTQKYLQKPFSDALFGRRFATAMLETDRVKMLDSLDALTRYVHRKMGGFEIDGFRLRSPAVRAKG